MVTRKVVVYLANLANTKFGICPAAVPLEIGYLKAYALSQLSKEVDIQLHRTFETLYKAIQKKKPDIIGFSWYGWNYRLAINASNYIKSKYPDIITVLGGASVSDRPEQVLKDFKGYPTIDIMIPNEGELPFVNLLKVFIKGGKDLIFKTSIDGVFYLSDSGRRVISGTPVPLQKDIDIFPSPYLTGCLDQFLTGELMPMVQTARGCPFHCSYCVSGKTSSDKVRPFNTERIIAEINYIQARANNKTLRFTDDNFGILPRDLEIASFIAENRKKTGYPVALRAYTYKRINDRTKEIILLLKDLIPMNTSVQTLSGDVLKNIERKNITLDQFHDLISWAHKNNIDATTEVIFGLPGETYDSFLDVINQLVRLRFDSVSIGMLMMLKETKIIQAEMINKHGYKILYGITERGFTKTGRFESVELDAWAVQNKYFSFEEYIKINLFITIYNLFMFFGYFKEMIYVWENRGVRIDHVILELIDGIENYPFFNIQNKKLSDCIRNNLFESVEKAREHFLRLFSDKGNAGQYIGFVVPFSLSEIIKGELIHPANREKVIDEVIKACLEVFNRNGEGSKKEFLEEVQFARILLNNIIIPFWEEPQELVTFTSSYDLISWRNRNYRGRLSEFLLRAPVKYKLKVRSIDQYINFVKENGKKPFYQQSEFFFRTFRTANVRRFIVTD